MIDPQRLHPLNAAPERPGGDHVLYWMNATRRTTHNAALEHAAAESRRLGRPLVVLEALAVDYPFASDRLHHFILHGMRDVARALTGARLTHHAYVERARGEGRGLVAALAERAALVVTDDFPAFVLPGWVARVAAASPVAMVAVDSAGLLPFRAAGRAFARAVDFRRHLQRTLRHHLALAPREDSLAGPPLPMPRPLAGELTRRWPSAREALLAGDLDLAALPLDHRVGAVSTPGGAVAAQQLLAAFTRDLDRYPEGRRHPDAGGGSGLSPHLHFGHLSAHATLDALARREGWDPSRLATRARGEREGFWGMGAAAEAFLDQLAVWRELGYGFAAHRADHAAVSAVPGWALATLEAHRRDPRPHLYTLGQLEAADTHDPLWNAAQRELVTTGTIHGQLRMLWGKKVLEWSPDAAEAAARLLELNDRYALDGRDPNSTSGIFWCLGRFDRPWAPERPIFGRVRYMSSASARTKLRLKAYLARFGG